MSLITILNIIIVNVIVILALSYFWSGWNFKVFKPWLWLEMRKRKQLPSEIERAESHTQDKIRFYSLWFALEQIDTNNVEGSVVFASLEDAEMPVVVRMHSPERKIAIFDSFANRDVEIVRENCQGEISRQVIHIEGVDLEKLKQRIGESEVTYHVGKPAETIADDSEKIALAVIDTVDSEELSSVMKNSYARMSEGGMMIVHDYNHNWDSVRRSVDAFEASIAENFLWLPDMYGSVIMIKNKKNSQL